MTRYNTRVQVYNSEIMGMFEPYGDVWDEAKDITRFVKADAEARASRFSPSPQVGTDRIITSHRRSVVPNGRYGTRAYVENTSSHAVYKHEGTNGPIVAHGEFMVIRPGKWGPRRAYSVSGQFGEPWLLEAANDVLSRYGVRAPGINVADLL